MWKREPKDVVKAIRLICGAARADAEGRVVAPEYVPQIEQARGDLEMMRGTEVVDALRLLPNSISSIALPVWIATS